MASEADSNGRDCFAKIQTFGAMLAKGIVRDCARVAGYQPGVGATLAGMIPDELGITLEKAWELNPELRTFVNSNPGYKKVWDIALKLEGTKKSAGTHACGHIPTPMACEELFPCSVDENGYLICQYNMVEAEHLGNLKKDLLMLRNLTIIDIAMKSVKERYGVDIPLWTEEILNDKEALAMIASGDTNGVFQLESEGMKGFMKNLKPTCFEDIIAGVALYRPGPMDYIPSYINGKHNPESIKYLTPELEPILSSTYGVIVYQEQVMNIVRNLAGFSMGRADVVRKAMGKKKMDIMQAERVKFVHGYHKDGLDIQGCIANGIPEEIAEKIYDQMIDFAKYAFNKSHAAAYAAISMQTAYLKAHYPLEFAAGLLTSVMDDLKKLPVYVSEYRLKGYEILAPDVNSSGFSFSPVGGSLCYGLSSIKNAGNDAINGIIKERTENGLFKSYTDFVKRCYKFGRKPIEVLIKSGALDFSGLSRRAMLESLEQLIDGYKKEQKKEVFGQMSLIDYFEEDSDEYENLSFDNIPDKEEYDTIKKLGMEKEATGFYISGHPLDPYMDYLKSRYKVLPNQWFIPSEETGDYRVENYDSVVIAGIVTENKVVYTKKDSRPMSIVTVEDSVCPVKVVLFPDVYEQYGSVSQKDELVAVRGTVKIDDKGISVFGNLVFNINNIPKDLYIKFKNKEDFKNKEVKLLEFARKYTGTGCGSILYCFDGQKKGGTFPDPMTCKEAVNVTPECIEEAQRLFGGEWNVKTKDFRLLPYNRK